MPQDGVERDRPVRDVSRTIRYAVAVLLVVLVGGLAWLTWWQGTGEAIHGRVLVLYGYSTLEEPFGEHVIPAFQASWRRQTGEHVEFVKTFAASGLIVQQILDRYPAEVAILSSEIDAQRVAGRLGPRRELPHGGTLMRTPMALLVRPGNPLGVRGMDDLVRADVSVLHCDPVTSGAGVWTVLAVYASAMRRTGKAEEALAVVEETAGNVTLRAACAREARRRFEAGEGDVLPGYLQHLRGVASRPDPAGEVVIPEVTIQSETIVVRVERNVTPANRDLVDAFVAWLWSPECQALLRASGFEEVLGSDAGPDRSREPIRELLTLADLGGAAQARQTILEDGWLRADARDARGARPGGADALDGGSR